MLAAATLARMRRTCRPGRHTYEGQQILIRELCGNASRHVGRKIAVDAKGI